MRYVLTGPPCSGKSSVFERLKVFSNDNLLDFQFFYEVAREAIRYFT
jgi:broad-specificity NMP kinase